MLYESELQLLRLALKKKRIQSLILHPEAPIERCFDMGLGQLLGDEQYYEKSFAGIVPPIEQATLYILQNDFECQYIYFLLPQTEDVLLIGPSLSKNFGREDVADIIRRHRLPREMVQDLEAYYGGIAVIAKNSDLFSMLEAFAERLWGSEHYSIENILQEKPVEIPLALPGQKETRKAKDDLWDMQIMERRYALENDLMQAVSRGQRQKAESVLRDFGKINIEQRIPDKLRNLKNYCIIMNTLLRKAAEQGGVHPLYLNKISTTFAHGIERMDSDSGVGEMMLDMTRAYCRLVKKYALQSYSAPVQKCIVCVDADLTQDLTLGHLAKLQNISAAYLSALFKKETGQTLTDYVNLKRVEYAKKLLRETDLQVQEIACQSGISDIHYFSRVFKKYANITPKGYRKFIRT
ncbi:MAG: helix-turn-helix transcriptional regulator [Clostridia bacterium]|nr:helix-turn-helix transcriptional regulator [Clostridia bacterium]